MYIDFKKDSLTGFIRGLNDKDVLKIVNSYLSEDNAVYYMCEFDNFCKNHNLSYYEIVEDVENGDFHSWNRYFRLVDGCFVSGDSIDDVYDYAEDDYFVEWLCGDEFDFSDYGIYGDDIVTDYCDSYEIDKEKLLAHPNWDTDVLLKAKDWDDVLDFCDIKEEEVKISEEE